MKSELLEGGTLRIDASSLPTLVKRMVRELPGKSFIVSPSAKEGKVCIFGVGPNYDKEALRKVVLSL